MILNGKWCVGPLISTLLTLNSNSVIIVHPLDEDRLSSKNIDEYYQYEYDVVNMTRTKL